MGDNAGCNATNDRKRHKPQFDFLRSQESGDVDLGRPSPLCTHLNDLTIARINGC